MDKGQPAVALGHFVLIVSNLEASYRFYADLGLRPIDQDESLGILELRGGTHLLLFQRNASGDLPSRGPLSRGAIQKVDLMIPGRTLEELEAFQSRILGRGVKVTDIPHETFFGHFVFHAADPDGNEVTICTSHASLPI